MSKFIIGFLLIISLYFLISTFLVFGIFDSNPLLGKLLVLFRDGFWFLYVIFLASKNFEATKNYLKKTYPFLLLIVLFLIVGIGVSHFQHKSISNMIIGIKYSILFMFIFYGAGLVGYIIATQKKHLNNFFRYYSALLIFIISFGFLISFGRILAPESFQKLGFGPVGDFVADQKPPVYYRTTSLALGGKPRLQGVFSGPNNYSYFLVLILPFSYFALYPFLKNSSKENEKTSKILAWGFFGLIIFSGLATWSRGFLVGGVIGMGLLLIGKIKKRYLSLGLSIIVILLIFYSSQKLASTLAHMGNLKNAVDMVVKNPIGYGLGTSGPAIHYGGSVLPENLYLQILIDTGIFGFAIWIGALAYIILESIKAIKQNPNLENDIDENILKLFLFGFLGLLAEGMFLHVVEDSMVNYLFFIPFGVIFGYNIFFTKNINLAQNEETFEEI